MFGMEAALFSFGNYGKSNGFKLHTQPGEQIIADKYAHVYLYEEVRNMCQVAGAINDPEFYHPLTSLVCVENTTNKGGGVLVMSLKIYKN
jgi:threonine aldolase